MPLPQHTPRVNNNDDVVRLIRVHVKAGDAVNTGDLVAEVETEKTSYTVEAERSGFVLAVVPEIDAMVEVGSILLWIGAAPERGRSPRRQASVASASSVAEPTVKAAQLLVKYGLRATEVPASGPASARKTWRITFLARAFVHRRRAVLDCGCRRERPWIRMCRARSRNYRPTNAG